MRKNFPLKDRKIHFINWKSINQTSDVVFPLAHSQKLITDLAYMRNKYCFFFASDHSTFSVKNSFIFFLLTSHRESETTTTKTRASQEKKSREKIDYRFAVSFAIWVTEQNSSSRGWPDVGSGYECVNFSSWLFSTSTAIPLSLTPAISDFWSKCNVIQKQLRKTNN